MTSEYNNLEIKCYSCSTAADINVISWPVEETGSYCITPPEEKMFNLDFDVFFTP